ncbi:hypothetical protein OBBRIDRAFT_833641 [Obba rivulosa]|uniref:Uncharacterized protein n=1 Tax=Obba rivulosa TaxID=1052685 RepID=A0A8E2DMH5_9APHY|nr:hypothetical protein OBBRIDRAFT_833641 [Obba rivulosa]
MDEDDIDVEALQAQVDMSMAFTENLVASWMKSSHAKLPSSKKRGNEEKELEEYMRRPPRLGVGAAPSESMSTFGRDTARLKGKLTSASKKRAREEEQLAAKAPSDDEEESRAGAIRKKHKIDPFAGPSKNKNKKGKLTTDTLLKPLQVPARVLPPTSTPARRNGAAVNNPDEPETGAGVQSSPTAASLPADVSTPPSSKKKKKHKKNVGADVTEEAVLAPHAAGHEDEETNAPREGQSERSPKTECIPSPPKREATPPPAKAATHVTNPLPKPNTAKLAIPLLNLAGPPPEPNSPESPQKKRRRKKKKKTVMSTDATGNSD